MEQSPQRRHGIDGLSHRPVSPRPQASRPPQMATEKLVSTSSHRPKAVPRKYGIAELPSNSGFAFNEGVSHPGLPQQHAPLRTNQASSFKRLVMYPFARPFDNRIARFGLIATVLDIRFWLVLSLPLLILRLHELAKLAPIQVVHKLNALLVAHNYGWGAALLGGLYLAGVLSVLIVAVALQVITAIKIRAIDHRVSRAHILVRHAISNILKTTLNWLIDSTFALSMIILACAGIYGLSISTTPWVVIWRDYLVGLIGLVSFLVLGVLYVRRKLQRAMLATTQLPVRSIQGRSLMLVVRNLPVSALALLLALLQLTGAMVITAGIGGIIVHYLPLTTTIPGRLCLWLLAAIGMGLVWLVTVVWQAMHWAGFYHLVVLRGSKDTVSDYLVPTMPLKLRVWPALVAAGLTLLVFCTYAGAVIGLRPQVRSVVQRAKQVIPSDARNIVPGIGQH